MLRSDVARTTIYGQIPGFVRRAQTPRYRVIRVSDVLSDPDPRRMDYVVVAASAYRQLLQLG